MITVGEVKALRTAAALAGDTRMVEICDVVLSGQAGWVGASSRASLWQPEKALVECIRVIAEAK